MARNNPTPSLPVLEHDAPRPQPLGVRAAHGVMWLGIAAVAAKLFVFIGQIVLAWYLTKADFGLISLTYTVTSFVLLIQNVGLREILVQRQAKIGKWENTSVWLSGALGMVVAIIMLLAAPVGAWIYGQPMVGYMVAVLALAAPMNALAIVPAAKLQIQLRFALQSQIDIAASFLTAILSVAAAILGAGALSFVIPVPIVALVRLLWTWMLAKPRMKRIPQVRRWRFLVQDSTWLFIAGIFTTLISQGDYALLGLTHGKEVVGIYFFAFTLSGQLITVLVAALHTVLLPMFGLLQHEPDRQAAAFINVCKLLALIAMPLCILQGVLAEPIIRVFFDEQWLSAIPVLQILSVAVGFRMVAGPAHAALKAQGRFREFCVFLMIFAMIFLPCVAVGAIWGNEVTVAIVAAAIIILGEPMLIAMTLRGQRQILTTVLSVYAWPVIISFTVSIAVFALTRWLRMESKAGLIELLIVPPSAMLLYGMAMWRLDRTTSENALARLRSVIRK